MSRKEEILQDVVIKIAGDSGDGMQLTGSQFTNSTALLGIDLATFPDFPAEIRAPQEPSRELAVINYVFPVTEYLHRVMNVMY